MRAIYILYLVAAAACYTPQYSDLTRCARTGDCPGDRICVDSFCRVVPIDEIDASVPDAVPIDGIPPIDAIQCSLGMSECDGVCVDLANDSDHCGVCSRTCATGMCSTSKCVEYIGFRDGANGATCTPNATPPAEIKQMVTVPYPVTLLKLGVIVTSEGAPPYRQRVFRASAPTVQLASTSDFSVGPMTRETAIAGGPLAIDAGDYLISFVANDTCYAKVGSAASLWAVVLH